MKSSKMTSPSSQRSVEGFPTPAGLEGLQVPSFTSQQRRTLGYLTRQFFSPAVFKDTGLEGLPVREFLELSRERRAFYHASETELRTGWWSSLLARSFLQSPESAPFREYLSGHVRNGAVVEIGPGEQVHRHRDLLRGSFGATHYLSVDLRKESGRWGAVCTDALSFLSLFENASVDTIMAFGVFNEPMSLQFPGHAPPYFILPARGPEDATRAHCEHEYVRRLAREMLRALKPGGVFLGDGIHSRGFEIEVETYLHRAGFAPDARGFSSLAGVRLTQRDIRDPFFFVKN
jgi:hypothetical protein